MGIKNPKELDWGPAGPEGGREGDPGNRIGSALATEMVIALTQLRSHARTQRKRKRNRNRFPGSGAV